MVHPLLELAPSLPCLPLGVTPSPLEQRPALAAQFGARTLLVKRDDLNGPEFGGNKLRALEFLLPGAGRHPVTMGGYGSTWCAALAVAAARQGLRAEVALFPQPWNRTVAGLLSTTVTHAQVHLAGSRWSFPAALFAALVAARRAGGGQWLAAGGAQPAGVLGSVNAALEFVRQVEAQRLARPTAIVLPLGSGGTAAGLLLGFRLAGWKITLIPVRVADRWIANALQVRRLARGTTRLLRRAGLQVPDGDVTLTIEPAQLGAGYGHATAAAHEAHNHFATAGIALDLTYSAKAAAALHHHAPRFPHLCFWHTFDARLVSAPALEHPLLRRAQASAESLWPHPKSI